MANFKYHAADADGQIAHGELDARDRNDLVALLQARGLFLMTCSLADKTPELSADPPASPAPGLGKMSDPTIFQREPEAGTLSWKEKGLLILILAAGVITGVVRSHSPHHVDTMANLNEKLTRIRIGMTRGQIETILTARCAGPLNPSKTCYFIAPSFTIEIAYGQQGGPGNPENQMLPKGSQVKNLLKNPPKS